jgi:hypothetical protein
MGVVFLQKDIVMHLLLKNEKNKTFFHKILSKKKLLNDINIIQHKKKISQKFHPQP